MVVALVDKPLLPCDPKLGNDQYIVVPVFPWLWTSWCPSWVIPSDTRTRQLQKIDFFVSYRRNSFDEIGQSSSSPLLSKLGSRHLLVLPVWIPCFLPSDSKTMGFYTAIHTKLQKVPSWCLRDAAEKGGGANGLGGAGEEREGADMQSLCVSNRRERRRFSENA
jgi:hypothetical protein